MQIWICIIAKEDQDPLYLSGICNKSLIYYADPDFHHCKGGPDPFLLKFFRTYFPPSPLLLMLLAPAPYSCSLILLFTPASHSFCRSKEQE